MPQTNLVDDGRVFSVEKSALLGTKLSRFQTETGISVVLVTKYYVPEGENTSEAQRFQRERIPNSPGLVVLYSRGNNLLSIAGNDALDQLFTRAEVRALIGEATRSGGSEPAHRPDDRLVATISHLTSSLSEKLAARRSNAASADDGRETLALLTGVAAVILALSAWLASAAIARSRRRKNRFLFFPPVQVAQRFGAAFGGGVVAQFGTSKTESATPVPSGGGSEASSIPVSPREHQIAR